MTQSLDGERLYALLPAVFRLRDAAHGEPLRALLSAVAVELSALEENIAQLYDDQFIETCPEWVAPYIGDLIGYRPLQGATASIVSPRADVANTIASRRRKGTVSMLEQLATDVTRWPAHGVEFFEQLATTQYMKHPRAHARATIDLRDNRHLLLRGGAFNSVAHSVEVRRPESRGGRYNIPNVGVFVWRLQSFRLTRILLTPDAADTSGRRFRFNPLGADLQLFRRPQSETTISQRAEPIHVPEPLSVRRMALALRDAQQSNDPDARLDDDYGEKESLLLFRGSTGVPAADICVGDLRDIIDPVTHSVTSWNHEDGLSTHQIAVDPERGRVLLGSPVAGPLSATFHYGGTHELGGGEYERTPPGADLSKQEVANQGTPLQPLLDTIAAGGRLLIEDSQTYAPTPVFRVEAAAANEPVREVVVAAANPARPLIAADADVRLELGARGRLVLDGLVISGGPLRLVAGADDEPRELILRHCTLVPGLSLQPGGSASAPGAASLIVEHAFARVTLERCITGPIFSPPGVELALHDCIIDASSPENVAFAAAAAGGPGGSLHVESSTLIGKVHTQQLNLGSNSIFFGRRHAPSLETWTAPLIADRRQQGCVRFSYVPPGSLAPRRHRCVPDATEPNPLLEFTSLRYGDAGYGQLRSVTARSIQRGADDEGEMGALHLLFQPQREANLRVRLEEYLRFGLHAGVFFAS